VLLLGTGKTLTGIKLLYWFVHMNRMAEENGKSHAQVLFCGPSDSAVDNAVSKFIAAADFSYVRLKDSLGHLPSEAIL
jgi:hypothetical protein